jgi:hypothetical protein
LARAGVSADDMRGFSGVLRSHAAGERAQSEQNTATAALHERSHLDAKELLMAVSLNVVLTPQQLSALDVAGAAVAGARYAEVSLAASEPE